MRRERVPPQRKLRKRVGKFIKSVWNYMLPPDVVLRTKMIGRQNNICCLCDCRCRESIKCRPTVIPSPPTWRLVIGTFHDSESKSRLCGSLEEHTTVGFVVAWTISLHAHVLRLKQKFTETRDRTHTATPRFAEIRHFRMAAIIFFVLGRLLSVPREARRR